MIQGFRLEGVRLEGLIGRLWAKSLGVFRSTPFEAERCEAASQDCKSYELGFSEFART